MVFGGLCLVTVAVDKQFLNTLWTGENFASEPGGLFEEPPTVVPPVTDPVVPMDSAVAQQKNGNILMLIPVFHQN